MEFTTMPSPKSPSLWYKPSKMGWFIILTTLMEFNYPKMGMITLW